MPTVWLLPTLLLPQLKVTRVLFGSFISSVCVSCHPTSEGHWPRVRERKQEAGSWGCGKAEAILSHAVPVAAPEDQSLLPFALSSGWTMGETVDTR